jgi:acetolactate synthase regulatory subunit
MADLDGKKLKHFIDPTLAKAFTHPLRGHIWVTLFERGVVSPTEVANELEIDVDGVSYHFRKLRKQELARLVRVVRRRGFDEHFYEPIAPVFDFDDAEWMKLPVGVRSSLSAETLRGIAAQLTEALAAGSFDARSRHLSQTWLMLDERGWEEALQAAKDLLHRFQAIQKRCAEDSKSSSEPGIPVSVVLAIFETADSIVRREGRGEDAE